MPKLIKPSVLNQEMIALSLEHDEPDCDCVKCKPNQFFAMVPFFRMKPCEKTRKSRRVPKVLAGRISYSTCILEFDPLEYIPIPDLSSMVPCPKQKYEFTVEGERFIYHGVFASRSDPTNPLIQECYVDWIELI